MPYDPPNQAAWTHRRPTGYAAYKVADTVTTPRGAGAWAATATSTSTRRSPPTAAFEVPVNAGVRFHDLLTVSLGGTGTIDHVINNTGAAAQGTATIPVDIVSFP